MLKKVLGILVLAIAAVLIYAATKLEFKRPFEVTNRVEFTPQPPGAHTQVTWAMSGPMPYVSKLMTTFVSMDRMVGPDFETGLANLKALAEKR